MSQRYHYIAIEREYGCGGTQIGEETARNLGISCCSQDIYEKVAKKLGMSAGEVESREENITNSFLYSVVMLTSLQSGKDSALSTEQKIHLAMQKEIREMADQGRCVFVGHCAIEALKDREHVLRVLIRADDDWKRERITREYGIAPESVEKTRERFDKKRRAAFRCYTAKKWEAPENYDMILDSSKLGIENCVAILTGLLQ